MQSGDIVKGGQQDRVLTVSLILPPKSGRIPIASFCVEQGRWTARGKEDVKTFATASAVVPSREAKLAMKAPLPRPRRRTRRRPAACSAANCAPALIASETGTRQHEVWAKVRKVQEGLSSNLGVTRQRRGVADQPAARAGEREAEGRAGRLPRGAASRRAKRRPMSSAMSSPSTASSTAPRSIRRTACSGKCGRSSCRRASPRRSGRSNSGGEATPSGEAAQAFLDAAAKGKSSEKPLAAQVQLETRDSDKSLYFETRRANGSWAHRSYLAK